ncbi:hypothetical protein HH1059_18000 [Halorhodospira halochloris]|uniref:Uncharacterized protein n=1 Tax=Halorhodospira halochloris TaxID=1052 RepID=A0A2Z6EZN9_HALHR|nr:hypothetical protein HH1059_18000 [Halorhodospira halochloris]
MAEANPLQGLLGCLCIAPPGGQIKGQADVLLGAQPAQQMKGLEDKTKSPGAQRCSSILIKGADILAAEPDPPAGGPLQPGQETEQGRFAGA